jgi:hypothetical protein
LMKAAKNRKKRTERSGRKRIRKCNPLYLAFRQKRVAHRRRR